MLRNTLIILTLTMVTACATKRFGRMEQVTATERAEFTCKDVRLEIARAEEFLSNIRKERSKISGVHVLGALGDFGIGNVMEGNTAEESGEKRLKGLQTLKTQKGC